MGTNEVTKCPTCGTTSITFDPPVTVEATEMCGAVRPGNLATVSAPRCLLPAGHEGMHTDIVEHTVSWSELPAGAALSVGGH